MAPAQGHAQGGLIFLADQDSLMTPMLPRLDLAKHRKDDDPGWSRLGSQSARHQLVSPPVDLFNSGASTHRSRRAVRHYIEAPSVALRLPSLPASARESHREEVGRADPPAVEARARRRSYPKGAPVPDSQPSPSSSSRSPPFASAPELADIFEGVRQLDRTAVLRGDLAEKIIERHELDLVLAQRRREVARLASEASRQSVRHRLQQKAAANAVRRIIEVPPAAPVSQSSRQSSKSSAFKLRLRTPPRSPRPLSGLLAPEDFADPLRPGSRNDGQEMAREATPCRRESIAIVPNALAEDPDSAAIDRRSILSVLPHKNSKEARLGCLAVLRGQGRKQGRAQRLSHPKAHEFDQLSDKEAGMIREVFDRHDRAKSGIIDLAAIDGCLADLGLKPITEAERRELRAICDEVFDSDGLDFFIFCYKLVPRARKAFLESRRSALKMEFAIYDKDRSGFLDEEECQQVLERLCTANLDPMGLSEMERIFRETIHEVADANGLISFDKFQELVGRSREHQHRIIAARVAEITSQEVVNAATAHFHANELVCLYDSFRRVSHDGGGKLGKDIFGDLLMEYGLWPRNEETREVVYNEFEKVDADDDGMITFNEFLQLAHFLRQQAMDSQEHQLRESFWQYDKDNSKRLDMGEISNLLMEIGIQPRSREDQMEMKALFDEIDEDESGDLCFQEFLLLVLRLQQRLGVIARCRQRLAAKRCGFDEPLVKELRDAFWALDREEAGWLGIDQLREALTVLRVPLSTEELEDLTMKYGFQGSGLVDFEGFIYFYSAVAPGGGAAP